MSQSRLTIQDTILDTIGNTPMVRLQRVGREHPVEILAKLEFFNPGGSIKDRIAFRMIRAAEEEGRIKPGDTLIEPTSGNTGIGLAMAGAVLGYKVIIVLPEKMSQEKQLTMESLGAQIIRTPTSEPHASPNSNFGVAERLQRALPNSHILGQFWNPENPKTHELGTAHEILEQTDSKIDYFVAGAGTGGTLTGCARTLKKACPNIKIVGVDPVGSLLGGGTESAPYHIEGIGYDFIPETLDKSEIDIWEKVNDAEAFSSANRLIREEGLLVGGSSGSAMQGALNVASRAEPGSRIVVMLVDGIRNYMTKFLCQKWMSEQGLSVCEPNKFVDWDEMVARGV